MAGQRHHHHFDIVLIGDVREGCEAAATLAGYLGVLAGRGLRVAIRPVRGSDDGGPAGPVRPGLAEAVRLGAAALVEDDWEPLWCRVAVAVTPRSLLDEAALPDLRADIVLVLAPEGIETEAYGSAEDLAAVRDAAGRLGRDQAWCPADAAGRAWLARHGSAALSHPEDWPAVLEPAFGRRGRRAPTADRRIVLGCMVGPDGSGWPAGELLDAARHHRQTASADDLAWRLRIEGADEPGRRAERLPEGWEADPAEAVALHRFLGRLDFLVVQPERPAGRPPRPVLEAMAVGRVVILSPGFRSALGDGLAYRTPEQVINTARYLQAEPAFYARYLAAQDLVLERHAPEASWRRLAAYLPEGPRPRAPARSRSPAAAVARPTRRRRVGFYPTNGIGLGHVTRLLAVARRLGPGLEPVFFTPCHALRVIEHAGYRTEYVSEPAYDETAPADHAQAPSLARAFRYHDVGAVVFDGNVPREALILAAAERDLPFVWVRRGMWRADPSLARFLVLARHADAVLEPEEVASAADAGVTADARDGAIRVPPIVLLDRGEPLGRAEARAALRLPADAPCALVQLGSGNNRDTELLLDHVLAAGERLGIELLVAEWLISDRPVRRRRARYISAFPNARYLAAFDFVVTAAGYNSFHELLHHGVPCVFLPNDDQRVDDQRARALFADGQGAGLCVPRGGEAQVGRYMEILLDRSHRRLIARRARELCPVNGAAAAAAAVETVLAGG